MASPTEFDIWYSCSAVPFHIPVTEGTVQIDCIFMMNMIKKNGLINGYPGVNGKDGEKDFFGLNLKSMIGNDGKKENDNQQSEKA